MLLNKHRQWFQLRGQVFIPPQKRLRLPEGSSGSAFPYNSLHRLPFQELLWLQLGYHSWLHHTAFDSAQ
jgi:hypothetical protein